MKLSSLFSKYLYQEKKLRLPGIGEFTLDPSLTVPDISDKLFADFLQNIQFSQVQVTSADEQLINYIRTETGKIKPLAESDLDSFLSDGKILLNIGKPFFIEGIGSLLKTRDGKLEFTPGEPQQHRMEPVSAETDASAERSKTFYLDTRTRGTGARRVLLLLGAIAGIVIVIWGGYILYIRNSKPEPIDQPAIVSVPMNVDSTRISAMPESFQRNNTDSADRGNGTYKFVIERTANKARALRRYNQLVDNLTPIKMETTDSTFFKLYFILPAAPSDTARIRDSLKIWYARKVVYVE